MYTFYFFILTYFVSPVNISEFIIESPNLLILSTLICLLKVKFCFAHKINAILIKLKKMMRYRLIQMLFHVFLYMNFLKNLYKQKWSGSRINLIMLPTCTYPEIFPWGVRWLIFLGGWECVSQAFFW